MLAELALPATRARRSISIIWSLSRSRPCITSAWSTSPAAAEGRDRAPNQPRAAPSRPADQQAGEEHRDRRPRVHVTDGARGH